ncbi:MAG TPA: aminotransferase class V-fold PLP-dependent enzyme [Planctomycetaceae bacterium]|jgi:selenocysteine lyase/cysteine desulfurase|nr:aminotransferase class V-fold PLP-dependent enzyme [Planctomycetaceae bacterium]
MLSEASRRRDFPSLDGMTYFNTAAEGIPPLAVGEALGRYFRDKQLGMDGRDPHFGELESAKSLVAEFYGLTAEEIAICSCSSEAFNLAALALRLREGDEVVINDLDFPSGATPWLQPTCPATVRLWRSREGALRVEDLAPLLNPRTRLVTTSLVSFFNGYRLPLRAVVETVRQHSAALLALDVTQALGRISLDLAGVDLIVSSTHKWILASHGGGLVGVPKIRAAEWLVPAGGWYHLEDAFGPSRFERAVSRPGAPGFAVGMPNFPAVYAIRAALDYLRGIGVEAIDRAARPLVLSCLERISRLPVELLTPREPDALAGIIAFRHPQAESVHRNLREQNVHVMHHAGRIRIAIHGYNTAADVETLLCALEQAL